MKNIIGLVLILTIFGCQKDSIVGSEIIVSQKNNVLNANAHIIDTSAIVNIGNQSITLNADKLQFKLSVGDIILASPSTHDSTGLLAKIMTLNDLGHQIVCTTEASNLNDAFKELHIDYTNTNTYSIATQATENGLIRTSSINNFALNDIIGSNIGITFNHNNNWASGFEVDGELNLNFPTTRIKYVKQSGSLLPDTVIVSAGFNTKGSSLTFSSIPLEFSEKTLYSYDKLPLIEVPIPIGPVILILPFTQKVNLNVFPAAITGKMKFTIYPNVSATLGVSYESGTWKNLSGFSFNTNGDALIKDNFDPSVVANVTAFTPSYEISPLGKDDLKLFFSIPNDFSLNIQTSTPNYLLKYNLDVNAGVKESFWNGKLEGEYSLKLPVYEGKILEGDFKKSQSTYTINYFFSLQKRFGLDGKTLTWKYYTFTGYVTDQEGKVVPDAIINFSSINGVFQSPSISGNESDLYTLNGFLGAM